MTRNEAAKLVYAMKAAYPGHFAKMGAEDYGNMAEVWCGLLEGYAYEDAAAGLRSYMANDSRGFPPSPGQVIDRMHRLAAPPAPTAEEAWAGICGALENSIYGAEEEFRKLHPLARKAIGGPGWLREACMMDSGLVGSVVKGRFVKAYEDAAGREREARKDAGALPGAPAGIEG